MNSKVCIVIKKEKHKRDENKLVIGIDFNNPEKLQNSVSS